MLKTITLTTTLLAAASTVALAADLPSRKPAQPAYVTPVFTWSGLYAGINAGYGWLNQYDNSSYADAWNGYGWTTAVGPTSSYTRRGLIGGGQIGYNYEISPMFVAGLETDLRIASIGDSDAASFGYGVPREVNWLGSVRGRLGVAPLTPNLLIYATGGFAYGGVKLVEPYWAGSSLSKVGMGWTAGAGAEWAFSPNWSVKLEYLYSDIGASDWGGYNSSTQRFQVQTIEAGLNYRFNWDMAPIVAKY